jgi:hypothetical protein
MLHRTPSTTIIKKTYIFKSCEWTSVTKENVENVSHRSHRRAEIKKTWRTPILKGLAGIKIIKQTYPRS